MWTGPPKLASERRDCERGRAVGATPHGEGQPGGLPFLILWRVNPLASSNKILYASITYAGAGQFHLGRRRLGWSAARDRGTGFVAAGLIQQVACHHEGTAALSSGWHLAKVASENDSQPERANALAGIRQDMADFVS